MSYVPTKEELNDAIQVALEDKVSPRDVYRALQKENSSWKLSQRKVAKYVKRQVKAKDAGLSPTGHEADDEVSVSTLGTMTSNAKNMVKSVSLRMVGKGKNDDSSTLASSSATGRMKSKFKSFSFRRSRASSGDNVPSAIPEAIHGITAPPTIEGLGETPGKGQVEYSAVEPSPLAPSTAETSAADSDAPPRDEGAAAVKNLEEALAVEEKLTNEVEEKAGAYTDDNDGKKDDCCAQGGCVIL